MSTIFRTLRNLRRIGFKEYGHQLQNIGDTKAGTFIAADRYGNKYYENLKEELPRTSLVSLYFLIARSSRSSHGEPTKRGDFGGGGWEVGGEYIYISIWLEANAIGEGK